MRLRLVILILAAFTSSVGLVVLLFVSSNILRDNPSSFLRLFPSHVIEQAGDYELSVNSYYLAGADRNRVYLGNHSAPLHVLMINRDLTDTAHVQLKVEGILDQKFWSVRVRVDSPDFYVVDGAVPRIYKGSLKDWSASRIGYDTEYFLDIEPMTSGSFVIKSLNFFNESVLGIVSPRAPNYTSYPDILKKQVDGVFCVDGTMSYSKESDRFVYVYRYRNQFIVADPNLAIQYAGRTIDTTTRAKISVATIASSGSHTLATPPIVVNRLSSTYGNWLFIQSELRAQNEHPRALKEAAVIDVYDLDTSTYKFSFYVFNHMGQNRLADFRVTDGYLVALFEKSIIIYDLNEQHFPPLQR